VSEAAARAVEAATEFVAAGAAGAFDDGKMPVAAALLPRDDVDAVLRRIRARSGCIVATGGCFDLLHPGHVATLEAARRLGDCLVVCLNSDDSVRRLKGSGRPLQPAADRASVLNALRCVDAVVVFDEDTPERVLHQLRPDVWVKGGDYAGVALPEDEVLDEWGGEVVTLPYLGGRSTTELVGLARAMSAPESR
jgi:D-beta-D-heptose 7-phosphate kinase/D-beta-D-heptose 1-phosphate adenosyltransferase